jgi:hypothetical protein
MNFAKQRGNRYRVPAEAQNPTLRNPECHTSRLHADVRPSSDIAESNTCSYVIVKTYFRVQMEDLIHDLPLTVNFEQRK